MDEITIGSRLKHAWNAFMNRDPTGYYSQTIGSSYSYRPDRKRLSRGNERSMVTTVYTKIATDIASLDIKHVRLDENGRYKEDMKSGLNNCLSVEANLDQSWHAFLIDAVLSMFDEGVVALVPVETEFDIRKKTSIDIWSMRTGKIIDWYPEHVKLSVYNEKTAEKQDIIMPKRSVAIVENPFYSIMNEPNSTMQRLVRKLALLDSIDEQSSSGKLDLIIQLPYTLKSPIRKAQAEERRKDIEAQLTGSKYGVAYTDGTERITQLNRPLENNLLKQIEYLTSMLYSQLGMTQSILDGTADEKTMLNYYNRIIEPIVTAFVSEMKRKFLTKTARSQLQSIVYFRDPFKLAPINDIANIADTFTRNEILTSNEIRQIIGRKPSSDPKADQLVNSNINQANNAQVTGQEAMTDEYVEEGGENQNGEY